MEDGFWWRLGVALLLGLVGVVVLLVFVATLGAVLMP